jgi:hypothetical protein
MKKASKQKGTKKPESWKEASPLPQVFRVVTVVSNSASS